MSSILFKQQQERPQVSQFQDTESSAPSSFLLKTQEKVRNRPPKEEVSFPFESSEDLEREMERAQAQSTSRILEGVLGAPGNIQSFVSELTGIPSIVQLPTTHQLQSFSEKATRGYTKPRTNLETIVGNLNQDIGSFMLPGSKEYGFLRNLGIPVLGSLTKEGMQNLNFKEGTGDLAKTGLMFFLDLLSQRGATGGGAKKIATQALDMAKKSTSHVPTFDASNYRNDLQALKGYLSKGGIDSTKTPAIELIDQWLKKIETNGTLNADELPAMRNVLNTNIESLGGFDPKITKTIKDKTIYNLNKLKDVLNNADSIYSRSNPLYGELSKTGNEAYSAYAQSNMVSNFLQKHFGNKIKSNVLKGLLGIGGTVGYGYSAIKSPIVGILGGALGASAGAGYSALKYGTRVAKSKLLRTYYKNLMKAVFTSNLPEASKNLTALDKEASAFEKKKKKESRKSSSSLLQK